MKKEDIAGLVVYMLIIATAVVYSLTILQTHYEHSSFNSVGLYTLFILGSLVIGILVNSILLELGHVIGALIGGYSITRVSILHLTLIKENDKWKLKFKNFDGLTGETTIVPKNDKSSPTMYLTLGTLFMGIWAIACFVIFNIKNTLDNKFESDLAYLFLTLGVVTIVCLIYNLLPLKLDSMNDGYSLRLLSNKNNKENYNKMLKGDSLINNENKEENHELITHTDITNITTELNLEKVYFLLNNDEYNEAKEIIKLSLNNSDKISAKYYLRNLAMYIYLIAMSEDLDSFKEYVSKNIDLDLRKRLFDDRSFASLRAFILIEGLVDNSKSECILAIGKVNNAYHSIKQNKKDIETLLYNKSINLISSIHPKWEMEHYLISK